jgi:hypothetical protein
MRRHLEAAWFTARCLGFVITRRPIEFFTQAVLGHSPLNPKE